MKSRFIVAVVLLAMLALGLSGSAVQSGEQTAPARNPFEEIKSGELPKCKSGVSSFLDERARKIKALVELCEPAQKANTRAAAMHLLGKMRAPEACPMLTEHLAFTLQRFITGKLSEAARLFGPRPAREALIEIGKPSLPHLLTRIKDSPQLVVGNICRGAIVKIEGRDHARELIEEAMHAERDPEAAKRLGKQLGFIEKQIKGRRK